MHRNSPEARELSYVKIAAGEVAATCVSGAIRRSVRPEKSGGDIVFTMQKRIICVACAEENVNPWHSTVAGMRGDEKRVVRAFIAWLQLIHKGPMSRM
jgi:hypothetical protein